MEWFQLCVCTMFSIWPKIILYARYNYTTEFSLIMQWRLLLIRQNIGKECEVMYIMYKLNIYLCISIFLHIRVLLKQRNYYLHIVQMNWISTTIRISIKKYPHPLPKKQNRYIQNIFGLQHRLSIYKWQRFL